MTGSGRPAAKSGIQPAMAETMDSVEKQIAEDPP